MLVLHEPWVCHPAALRPVGLLAVTRVQLLVPSTVATATLLLLLLFSH